MPCKAPVVFLQRHGLVLQKLKLALKLDGPFAARMGRILDYTAQCTSLAEANSCLSWAAPHNSEGLSCTVTSVFGLACLHEQPLGDANTTAHSQTYTTVLQRCLIPGQVWSSPLRTHRGLAGQSSLSCRSAAWHSAPNTHVCVAVIPPSPAHDGRSPSAPPHRLGPRPPASREGGFRAIGAHSSAVKDRTRLARH